MFLLTLFASCVYYGVSHHNSEADYNKRVERMRREGRGNMAVLDKDGKLKFIPLG